MQSLGHLSRTNRVGDPIEGYELKDLYSDKIAVFD